LNQSASELLHESFAGNVVMCAMIAMM